MRPPLITIAAILFIFMACAGAEDSLYKKSAEIMSTSVTITVRASAPKFAEEAIEKAFDEIRRMERLMSFWTDDSEIAAIYQNAGKSPVKISTDTLRMVEISTDISRETAGAFDPTVGPLMRLWNFKDKSIPSEADIAAKLNLVDYRRVVFDIDASTAYLEVGGMSFDTGGIAKGYAVDRAIEMLRAEGIGAALVAIAGDIRGYGLKPDGSPWRVGIRDPRGDGPDDIIATLELRDEAVSTSGDYERFFINNGQRYHHILDPRTGKPARGIASITVIAPEAVLADGYSTGVFVMGPDKGLKLLERLGMEGIILTTESQRRLTAGIGSRVNWK